MANHVARTCIFENNTNEKRAVRLHAAIHIMFNYNLNTEIVLAFDQKVANTKQMVCLA